jgi:hypothetical protein
LSSGKHIPAEEVNCSHPLRRKNWLHGGSDPDRIEWFEFGDNDADEVAKNLVPFVEVADKWFHSNEPTRRPGKGNGGLIERIVKRLFAG